MTLRSIPDLLHDLVIEEPDAPALTVGDRELTRAELDATTNRLARTLATRGVGYGSFVSILLENSLEFVQTAVACWKLGATPQPVAPRMAPAEREAVLELVEPCLVVVRGEPLARWPCLDADVIAALAGDATPIRPSLVSPSWKAMTSGGSTGRPKVIVSTLGAMRDPDEAALYGMQRGDVQMVPGPLFFNASFASVAMGLCLGQHVIVMPRFDAATALDLVARHRVTLLQLVPTMMNRILREVEASGRQADLTSLRLVNHTGGPCPPWLKARWIELVGPDGLLEGYGCTEQIASTSITGREWLDHVGSVGRPKFGEFRVLDEEGSDLGPGQVGELYMRAAGGPGANYRYLGAEAKVLDGWESVGDMGWIDESGWVYLADRRTDLILSGGANVYPAEVEAAIVEHDAVVDAVVVGLPDDDLGQRVHAIVQVDAELDEEQLRVHLAERLLRYKVPRSFELTPAVLRDPAGKVRRGWWRERAIAGTTGTASASDGWVAS